MRCSEVMLQLEKLAPLELACSWDNPGLLVGRSDKIINRVLIALDATEAVIEQAVQMKADMIITHHPLIFHAVKKINDEDFLGKRLITLLQKDIVCYAMHTNFDIAPGCMADLAADRLGMNGIHVLEETAVINGCPVGIGKTGELSQKMTLYSLSELVKKQFGIPHVTVYGQNLIAEPVWRIAISPGSGKSEIQNAVKAGVQVLITGDIGHHEGIDAVAAGMAVIDAGHYGLEHIFMEYMEHYIQKVYGPQIEVRKALSAFPAIIV